MPSQWDCLLQNLGEWEGSLARLSPDGEWLEETPTLVTLEGRNQNRSIYQLVRRFLPSGDESRTPQVQDKTFEYSSLGRGILLFEDGAFSQGSMQWGPFSEFGAELGAIDRDRRLRLGQLYDRDSQLDRMTLIRERRAGTEAPERPPLAIADLLGEWHGEAVTSYPDLRPSDRYPTHLSLRAIGDSKVQQELQFGGGAIASTGTIRNGWIDFEQGTLPVRVLLLPDGASSTCPLSIRSGCTFFLELGWLLQPDLRVRLIRRYNGKGEWVSLTHLRERKVGSGG
jgi:hypothetical protein